MGMALLCALGSSAAVLGKFSYSTQHPANLRASERDHKPQGFFLLGWQGARRSRAQPATATRHFTLLQWQVAAVRACLGCCCCIPQAQVAPPPITHHNYNQLPWIARSMKVARARLLSRQGATVDASWRSFSHTPASTAAAQARSTPRVRFPHHPAAHHALPGSSVLAHARFLSSSFPLSSETAPHALYSRRVWPATGLAVRLLIGLSSEQASIIRCRFLPA
jgi:hypothetical protein